MTFFVERNDNDRQPPPLPPGRASVPADPGVKVGPLLKARRLELGLKYKAITKEIKIKPEYLKAIEDEDFDLLPAPEYLRLFLRTYAEFLGFETQEIYGIFDTQEMPVKKPEKKESRKETPKPGLPKRDGTKAYIWIGAVAVLALFLIVLWLFGGGKESPSPAADESVETATTDSLADTTGTTEVTEVETPASPPSPRYWLQVTGLDSTWMVIQADSDTVFIGFIEPGGIRSWMADSAFKFSLSNYNGVEAVINGYYLKPFREWRGPVQAREVGGFNLDRYIDSTRLAQREGEVGTL